MNFKFSWTLTCYYKPRHNREHVAATKSRARTQENVAGSYATLILSCYIFLCMHVPVMILSLLNIAAKRLCDKCPGVTGLEKS